MADIAVLKDREAGQGGSACCSVFGLAKDSSTRHYITNIFSALLSPTGTPILHPQTVNSFYFSVVMKREKRADLAQFWRPCDPNLIIVTYSSTSSLHLLSKHIRNLPLLSSPHRHADWRKEGTVFLLCWHPEWTIWLDKSWLCWSIVPTH